MAPHLTLVPPVNVRADELDAALALMRAVAAGAAPLSLRLGPVATFWPETPVVYLSVGGDLDALGRLYGALGSGPLTRPVTRPFVPHVTLVEDASPEAISGAVAVLGGYEAALEVDRVHLLEQVPGPVWQPLADAPLGGGRVVGRGGLELELSVGDVTPPDARTLTAGEPFVVTARGGGAVVGVATGRLHADLWLEQLAVDRSARHQGIGSHLLAEVELVGARAGRRRALAACAPEAERWFRERGWVPRAPAPGSDLRYLVRDLGGRLA
jgi:2'-5' RNA ligase